MDGIEGTALTRNQVWAMCQEAKRLCSQSEHHMFAAFVLTIANLVAIVFMRMTWQMWLLLPMAAALMVWGYRELFQSKRIIDRLNAEILGK